MTSLRNSIQYKITNQLREELGIEEYETEDLLYQIFKNFRLSPNNVTGLRLSPYGLKIMKKGIFTKIIIDIKFFFTKKLSSA